MEQVVAHCTSLDELKKQFIRQFPNLRLRFLEQPRKVAKRSLLARHSADPNRKHSPDPLQNDGVFSYNATTTVAAFERCMQSEFGLSVQVFRQSGGLWIEIVQVEDWSLGEQNALGSATERNFRFNCYSLFL